LRHIAAAGRNLASHFGEHLPVADLTPDRLNQYVRLRWAGRITGSPVQTSAIARELTILKGALNWARGVYEGREPLLQHHPLASFRIPSERDPKRPVVNDTTTAALRAVADEVHPYLRTPIVVARTTGRQLSAVLGLRWEDIDFDEGTIRWRAEHDKLRKTWVVPAARATLEELGRFRARYPGLGQAPLFSAPQADAAPRCPCDTASRRLLAQAGVRDIGGAEADGSMWHAFRRFWATERRTLPVKDVAAAGGWKDVTTLIECYQQPDSETLRAVADFVRPAVRPPMAVPIRPARSKVTRTLTHTRPEIGKAPL
jgi:integrase